jgi:RND family efflux transporter MFP subunit
MRRHGYRVEIWAALALMLAGCERLESQRAKDADRPAAAAGGLVRASAAAQQGIGLVVEKAARQQVAQSLSATGWLTVRPGSEVVVKSPAAGFILAPSGRGQLELGSAVGGGDEPLGLLQVLLSLVEQADLISAKKEADILIRQSLVTLERAEAQLERLKGKEDTIAGTRLADLQETADRARVAFQEAQKKLPFLPDDSPGNPAGMKPLPLRAPLAGRIIRIHVSPRQLVTQGDPLWTIADWSSLWVRVPVFVGDLSRLARSQEAQIRLPGSEAVCPARPLEAPQPVEAGHRNVDLYYQIDNAAGSLRPGQAVTVLLPLGGASEQIVVRRAAIVWDGMGNSWVYVRTGPQDFRRRRVELGEGPGEMAAIQRGLQEGEAVVTKGAEALYGEEFKGEIPVEEEEKK